MILFSLIKTIILKIIKYLKKEYNLIYARKINPTCKIYEDVKLHSTLLEGFNVIFDCVSLTDCFIGKHTYIQKNTKITNATIGKFCSIASNVSIGPGIHKIDSISTHPSFYLKKTPLVKIFSKKDFFISSKKTHIGNDVWIGENAVVIDGVYVGSGAIIAAGAVVTRNVEPYAIVGGIPARFIRYRFSKEIIEGISESEWWNKNEEWFENNCDLMLNTKEFLKSKKIDT